MSTENLHNSLRELTTLISRVSIHNGKVMDKCLAIDCVHTDKNKICEQHSRCADCPQVWRITV